MKSLFVLVLAALIAFAAAWQMASRREAGRGQELLAEQRKAWEAEKAQLEATLKAAQRRSNSREAQSPVATASGTPEIVEVVKRPGPKETLDELVQFRLRPGENQTRLIKQVIQHSENLVDAGAAALPVIREFLGRNLEFDYEEDTDEIRSGWRDGRITMDFILAPSLRLGLLNVVKRIGGSEAEQILMEVLGTTGRGVEVAYAARLLEELTPGKYRDAAIASARELLTNPVVAKDSPNRTDRYDRNWLFGLLTQYKDASLAGLAQSQLIREDGKLDYSSMRYLKDVLQEQSIPVWQQTYADPRLDPKQKEPLVQVALAYAGMDPRANAMVAAILSDPTLPKGVRDEAVHDLPHRGLEDRRNPTERDLQILESRVALVAALRANTTDKQLAGELERAARRLTETLTGTGEKKMKNPEAAGLGGNGKPGKKER